MEPTIDVHEKKQFIKMTETPVGKMIAILAVPSVISMMTTAIYSIADTYFVSKIGTSASAAVGIVMPVMFIFQAIGFTFATGSGNIISLYLGKRDKQSANKYAVSGLIAALCLSTVLAFFTYIFLVPILRLFGSTETILPYAKDYSYFILLGSPFLASGFVLNFLLRSQGKNFFAMIGIMSGGILNLILDPIFIFTLDMGITGASLATCLSKVVTFLVLLVMVKRNSLVELKIKQVSFRIKTYIKIIKIGAPSFFRQGLGSVAGIALNNRAAVFGDPAVAAISIVNRLSMMLLSVMLGIGQGFQPVAGYNYGAKKYKRVRESYLVTLKMMLALVGCVAVVMFILAPYLLTSFRADDPKVISIGTLYLRIQCVTLLTQPFLIATNMMLQSTGHSRQASFVAILRQGLYFFPLVTILPSAFGLLGVQLTQPLADVFSALHAGIFAGSFLKELTKKEHKKT